jgi:outer membrane protein assembly factor BamE
MILLAGAAFLATGCVYRMNIQQGNYLAPEAVAQLKEGMTRSQVRFLLGTPMVPVAFNDDRWDYYFYLRTKQLERPAQRRVTVFFDSDKVVRFEDEGGLLGEEAVEAMEKGVTKAPKAAKAAKAAEKQDDEKRPDPVPASAPAPAPAGTPSGQP